jgi:hypothetical protein
VANATSGGMQLAACPPQNPLRPEFECSQGSFTFKDGFWYDGLKAVAGSNLQFEAPVPDSKTSFYLCICSTCCTTTNASSGGVSCIDGSTGILCGICSPDYYRSLDGKCSECTDEDKEFTGGIVILAVLFFLFLVTLLVDRTKCTEKGVGKRLLDTWKRTVPVLKLVVTFYQVVCLVGDVYQVSQEQRITCLPSFTPLAFTRQVPFPEEYLQFLAKLKFVNIQFLTFFRLQCISQFNYHDQLKLTVWIFLLLLVVQLCCECAITNAASTRAERAAGFTATVTYFVYPGFSASIFQAFNCITVDGTRYLRVDLSVGCDSEQHEGQMPWAWIGMVCSIGAPVLYAFLLNEHRKKNEGRGSSARESHLSFLTVDYQPRYWYWELIIMVQKLLLTGLASLWFPGTLMQVITSMFVALTALVAVCVFRPFRGKGALEKGLFNKCKGFRCAGGGATPPDAQTGNLPDFKCKVVGTDATQESVHSGGCPGCKGKWSGVDLDHAIRELAHESVLNAFAMFQAAATLLTLFGALLVKINASYESTGLYEEGYNYQSLQYGLISVAIAILVVGAALILDDIGMVPWMHIWAKIQSDLTGEVVVGGSMAFWRKSHHHSKGDNAKALHAFMRRQQLALDGLTVGGQLGRVGGDQTTRDALGAIAAATAALVSTNKANTGDKIDEANEGGLLAAVTNPLYHQQKTARAVALNARLANTDVAIPGSSPGVGAAASERERVTGQGEGSGGGRGGAGHQVGGGAAPQRREGGGSEL